VFLQFVVLVNICVGLVWFGLVWLAAASRRLSSRDLSCRWRNKHTQGHAPARFKHDLAGQEILRNRKIPVISW
jgi:hypothetical protein